MNPLDKLIDKVIDKKIQRDYSDLDRTYRDTEKILRERLSKSREYRIMLRDYQQKLKDRELSINKRECELKKAEESIKARVLKECYDEKDRVEKHIDSLKEYEKALRQTEFTMMDWIKRVEAKEVQLFAEMQQEVNEFKNIHINIDGFEFEEYVAEFMRRGGFEDVKVTQKSQDFGADILGQKDGVRYVVQCKYYTNMVGIEAVQQIYAAKEHYDAHVAIVATNNVFTKAAKILAEELNVVLWDCLTLDKIQSET